MTPDEFLGRVRTLLPALRERAPRAEQLRRLPDETFADFQEAGLFRAMQPKRYGGFELDPGIFYQAVMEIAAVCGSTGWVYGVLAAHNWHLALFPPQAQEDVWGEDDSVQTGDLAGADRHDRARSRRFPGQGPVVVFKRLRFLPLGRARRRRAAGRRGRAARAADLPAAAFRLRDRRQLARHGAVRHRQQGHRRPGRLRAGVSHPFLSRRFSPAQSRDGGQRCAAVPAAARSGFLLYARRRRDRRRDWGARCVPRPAARGASISATARALPRTRSRIGASPNPRPKSIPRATGCSAISPR